MRLIKGVGIFAQSLARFVIFGFKEPKETLVVIFLLESFKSGAVSQLANFQ